MIGNQILFSDLFRLFGRTTVPFTLFTLSHIFTFSWPQLIFVDNHDPLAPHLSQPYTDREESSLLPPNWIIVHTMQTNSASTFKQHTKSSSCSEIDIKSLNISSGTTGNNKKREEKHTIGNKSTESVTSLRSEHSNSNPQQGSKMAIKSYAEMARGPVVEQPPQVQVHTSSSEVADTTRAKKEPKLDDQGPNPKLPPPEAETTEHLNTRAVASAPISAPAAFSAGAMPLHPHFHVHQQNQTPFTVEAWEHRKKTKVPPNKKDTRKLFVGGLPTDGKLYLISRDTIVVVCDKNGPNIISNDHAHVVHLSFSSHNPHIIYHSDRGGI